MNRVAVPAAFAIVVAAASYAQATNWQLPPGEIATAVSKCQNCHDTGTDNSHRENPRLNGQHYQYLVNQLHNFRDPTRQDPHAINTMWPVATQASDELIFALASFFSAQPATEPPRRHDALAEEGRRIFMEGAPNVPACLSCHGVQGQGTDTVPRLAGQHAVYLAHAMESLRFALRESKVMHPELNNVDEEQIKALLAYLGKD